MAPTASLIFCGGGSSSSQSSPPPHVTLVASSSVGGSSHCKGVQFNGVDDALGLKSKKKEIQQRPPGRSVLDQAIFNDIGGSIRGIGRHNGEEVGRMDAGCCGEVVVDDKEDNHNHGGHDDYGIIDNDNTAINAAATSSTATNATKNQSSVEKSVEKKRSREKQRRLDTNSQLAALTDLVQDIDATDLAEEEAAMAVAYTYARKARQWNNEGGQAETNNDNMIQGEGGGGGQPHCGREDSMFDEDSTMMMMMNTMMESRHVVEGVVGVNKGSPAGGFSIPAPPNLAGLITQSNTVEGNAAKKFKSFDSSSSSSQNDIPSSTTLLTSAAASSIAAAATASNNRIDLIARTIVQLKKLRQLRRVRIDELRAVRSQLCELRKECEELHKTVAHYKVVRLQGNFPSEGSSGNISGGGSGDNVGQGGFGGGPGGAAASLPLNALALNQLQLIQLLQMHQQQWAAFQQQQQQQNSSYTDNDMVDEGRMLFNGQAQDHVSSGLNNDIKAKAEVREQESSALDTLRECSARHHSSDGSAGAKNPSHSVNHDVSVLGKVREHFPFRLYDMLEYAAADDGLRSIVTWSADGRSFSIHQKDIFMEHIVPKFFKTTKFRSFTRQLNLWEFTRLNTPVNAGSPSSWMHPHFIRGNIDGLYQITRVDVKFTYGSTIPTSIAAISTAEHHRRATLTTELSTFVPTSNPSRRTTFLPTELPSFVQYNNNMQSTDMAQQAPPMLAHTLAMASPAELSSSMHISNLMQQQSQLQSHQEAHQSKEAQLHLCPTDSCVCLEACVQQQQKHLKLLIKMQKQQQQNQQGVTPTIVQVAPLLNLPPTVAGTPSFLNVTQQVNTGYHSSLVPVSHPRQGGSVVGMIGGGSALTLPPVVPNPAPQSMMQGSTAAAAAASNNFRFISASETDGGDGGGGKRPSRKRPAATKRRDSPTSDDMSADGDDYYGPHADDNTTVIPEFNTEEQRIRYYRERNREHARKSRIRKKAYVERLKISVDELRRERDTLLSERSSASSQMIETHSKQVDVLSNGNGGELSRRTIHPPPAP